MGLELPEGRELDGKGGITAQDVETLVKQPRGSGRPRGVPSGGEAMNAATVDIETVPADVAERVRGIRFRLPGQAVRERIELARVAYGPLYSIGLIRERVAETLLTRIGYVRSTAMELIEEYRGLIPDEVLLKYDEAERSGLFAKF
jgi:hypothetical protein